MGAYCFLLRVPRWDSGGCFPARSRRSGCRAQGSQSCPTGDVQCWGVGAGLGLPQHQGAEQGKRLWEAVWLPPPHLRVPGLRWRSGSGLALSRCREAPSELGGAPAGGERGPAARQVSVFAAAPVEVVPE